MAAPPLGGATGPPGGSSAANDNIVRGELVEHQGRPTLVAVRRLRWGTQVLSEKPILLVEADPDCYLRAADADARLVQLAEALGDPTRLAAYIAFKQLHERKQKELLALWREGIEETDPLAAAIIARNRQGVDAFVADRPEFSRLVYWHHFIMVASIFGRFGVTNPDGTRAVYEMCSHVRHSCRPNAAWFTLRRGFPKGKKQLHVIAIDGVTRGEEITVTEADESVLVLPKPQRALRMFRGSGVECDCRRCREGDPKEDERIRHVFAQLEGLLALRPPTDESTKEALLCLKELDKLLPFSMQVKAKAKVLLATAFGELSQRAAWQEENRGANIIQWTGLDAEAQEQRLKDTKKLYETAAKDFEYLLGQDALAILKRLEVGYAPVHDQHKMLSKYAREREREPERKVPPTMPAEQEFQPPSREALPPGWDELFNGRNAQAAAAAPA